MKFYVSFGQVHKHIIDGRVFDKDCIAVLDCATEDQARDMAFSLFGRKWCLLYTELPEMKFFPNGLRAIERGNIENISTQ